jgi:hypothetical protein
MSSMNSRRTPDSVEHHSSVLGAAVEVAENSFFAFVDPVDVAGFEELTPGVPCWLEVSVAFGGAFAGIMRVVIAQPLAVELFTSFLGLEPGEPVDDPRLFDLVGELGNMVCGSWLTKTCRSRRFNLEPPSVCRLGAPARPVPDALLLAMNGQPVWVRLEFAGP